MEEGNKEVKNDYTLCSNIYSRYQEEGDWIGKTREEKEKNRFIALKKMAEVAKTFSEWELIRKSTFGTDGYDFIESRALEEMSKLAETFDEHKEIYDSTSYLTQSIKEIAFEKMVQSASTFYEWDIIRERTSKGSELETTAIKKMAELAKKFHQRENVWKVIHHEFHISSGLYDYSIREPEEKRKLQTIALEKMTELAKDFSECLKIHDKISPESELKTTTLKKMAELAEKPTDWLLVWERAPQGSDIEKDAYNKASGHGMPGYPQW